MKKIAISGLLGLGLILAIGCKSEEPAAATTAPPATGTGAAAIGRTGAELGSSEATPLMSNADAEKRLGSATGK